MTSQFRHLKDGVFPTSEASMDIRGQTSVQTGTPHQEEDGILDTQSRFVSSDGQQNDNDNINNGRINRFSNPNNVLLGFIPSQH